MKGTKNQHPALQFTGNWFIDAGILGFVNLMEEVYGWDLEELQKKIKENEDVLYYWYFPIGYICHVVKEIQIKEGLEKIEQINNIIDKIPKVPQFTNKNDLFEKAWKWITSNKLLITEAKRGKSTITRIKINWSGRYRILTNFPLFQPGYDIERQKNIFMSLLGLKEIEDNVLIHIDKTTSKFLPSASDFLNISYTKSCINIYTLVSLNTRAPVFILTYPLAFISKLLEYLGYQIMFYSPDLIFTYKVNKKLKIYLNKLSEEKKQKTIFKITWWSIIDSITELESLWSLENMYLIKIKPPKGQKQDLEMVEYIGIPKLQASILFEDKIRNVLNTQFEIGKEEGKEEGKEKGKDKNRDRNRDKTDGNKTIWLLEEFVKRTFVYDKLLKHTNWALKCGQNPKFKASLYALAIDARIKENAETSSKALFSNDFFREYKFLVDEIKETYSLLVSRAILISQLFENEEEKSKLAYPLFSALKKKNRISFVNTLLKKFTELSKKENLSSLIKFIFEKIISNDVSWENYALALIIGILTSRGGEDGGEIQEE